MRKILFLSAIAISLGMASCSSDETVGLPDATDNAITFRPILDKGQTRAGETTAATITDFKVFAHYSANTGTDLFKFMNGQIVERVGTTSNWVYSPTRFWPNVATGTSVTFYAYSPATSVNLTTTGTGEFTDASTPGAKLTYTASTTFNQQEDLLWAKKEADLETSVPTDVSLNFSHALSQIVFSAKGATKGLVYEISDIHLTNLKTTGVFDFSLGTWAPASVDNYPNLLLAPVNIPYHATDFTPVTSNDYGKGLFIIPQKTADITNTAAVVPVNDIDASDNSKSFIYVTYKVKDPANFEFINGTYAISLDDVTFAPNTRYNYQLTLGVGFQALEFSVTVSGITDAAATNVNL